MNESDKRPYEAVYKYIQKHGLVEEKYYPYENSIASPERKECRLETVRDENGNPPQRTYIDDYKKGEVKKGCTFLSDELEKGPVVVGLDARNFRIYEYGRFTDCQRKITHYALLVGKGIGYWKVRNSWGKKWGERGYIRIRIEESSDVCGICLRGSVPVSSSWF